MKSSMDFVVFSDDWGRHPSSCQHIFKRILEHNRTVWVDTIGIRSPKFSLYDLKRSADKLSGWIKGKDNGNGVVYENLKVIDPLIIPYNTIGLCRLFNKKMTNRTIRKNAAENGIFNPVFVTTLPNAVDYASALEFSLHVYYCVDDFVHWPGVDSGMVTEMEDELLVMSDVVFASSQYLCDAKRRDGVEPILLPHGVDVGHFGMGDRSRHRLEGIPGPRIGFFGAISDWVDCELISHVAKSRPQWSIVMIGRQETDVSMLKSCRNVHLLGPVPYAALPEYAAGFDVGIIPFVVNELTKSVNPLKLLEYLACGLGVVSTDMPEVRRFSEHVHIASGFDDFIDCIEVALGESSADFCAAQRKIAGQYSWESITTRFCGHIWKAMERKV